MHNAEVQNDLSSRAPARFCILCLIIIGCAVYLGLMGLGHCFFWDDEALVALHAKNYLSHGTWTAWSGRNLAAYDNGILLADDLTTKDPKIQMWLAAAAFKLLGISEWSGRLPFALVGLAGLLVFILILRLELKTEYSLILCMVALLAFSPVFLLNIRQCRYYSPCLTFALLTYYFYRRCCLLDRRADFFWLAGSAAILFYTQYLSGSAFLAALGIMHLACHRRQCTRKVWMRLGGAFAVFLLLTVPFLVRHHVWIRAETPTDVAWYIRKPTLLWWHLRDLNVMTAMPWVIALALGWILFRYRKLELVRRFAWPWCVLVLAFHFVLAFVSFQTIQPPNLAMIRYVIPVVPFLFGLVGFVVWFVARRSQLLAVVVFVVLLSTNLLTLWLGAPLRGAPLSEPEARAALWVPAFRWLLPSYIWEIHHRFRTPGQAVVDYVRNTLPRDARVHVEPEILAYTLMFYLDDYARFCGELKQTTPLPRRALAPLGAALFIEEVFPDWYITFGFPNYAASLLGYLSRPHEAAGNPVAYSYALVANLETYWFDTSRPELPAHTSQPIQNFDPKLESVYIFKRTANPRDDLASWRRSLEQEPDSPTALNNVAWALATSADPACRNGVEAVRLAERACGLRPATPALLDTLAAAYAEAGRFEEAVATMKQARVLAERAGETNSLAKFESRLQLYDQRTPYHAPE